MVQISYAESDEREEIAQFMCAAFQKAKWGIDGWRRVLDGRWNSDAPCAITVRDAGVLVGVLGQIATTRMTPAGPRRAINLTSWYILKPYRGMGLGGKMMSLAIKDTDVSVTNLSSAKGAVSVVKRVGFKVLDSQRMVWRATGQSNDMFVTDNPLGHAEMLTPTNQQILKDHAGLNLQSRLVETPDGPCLVMMMVKQKHDEYLTYETMYLSDKAIFAHHARAIANSILPETGAVLAVDCRFVTGVTEADAVEDIEVPRFFTPGLMNPEDVDHLYSEIVLLDMKMY